MVEGACPRVILIAVAGCENGTRTRGMESFIEFYPGWDDGRERVVASFRIQKAFHFEVEEELLLPPYVQIQLDLHY